MKLIYTFLISSVLIFVVGGCDIAGNLELYPEDSLTEGNFYEDQAQMQAAVDDLYRQMGRLFDAYSVADLYGNLFSDDGAVTAQLAGTPVDQPIDRHEIRAHNGRILTAWEDTYNVIFNSNNIIKEIEDTEFEIDEGLKSKWLSQALVVRSLAYFNLVRAFGEVPLVLDVITAEESFEYTREDTGKIYDQLIEDLKFSIENLPEKYSGSDIGRFTKYSAAAVLAKVYLTLGDDAAAQSELENIINSGQYSLDANNDGKINAEDYNFLFEPDTKNCQASILEAQYKSGTNARNSSHQEAYSPYLDNFKHPLIDESIERGGGINTPTDDLVSEFEEGDPRKEVTVVPGFTTSSGNFVEYPFTLKFFDPDWFNPGQNFEVIRYADILLMYAEVTEDPEYLNKVRARAGMPLYGTEEYPSDLYPTLALAIEHERRVEFALEMHRMFDLVRTGRGVEVMQSKVSNISSDKLLFPIPQDFIDKTGVTQNPGY